MSAARSSCRDTIHAARYPGSCYRAGRVDLPRTVLNGTVDFRPPVGSRPPFDSVLTGLKSSGGLNTETVQFYPSKGVAYWRFDMGLHGADPLLTDSRLFDRADRLLEPSIFPITHNV